MIDVQIRSFMREDGAQIVEIYNHYIATSRATFETEPIDVDEMVRRMDDLYVGGYPFLVCEENDEIVGYAYGHQFRQRRAYRRSIEVSVYTKPGHEGKHIGTMLYEKLFSDIKD